MPSNVVEVSVGVDQPDSEVLLREAEHRHGNTLQILSSLVRRNLREAETPEVREVLSTLNELIDTMVGLHKLSQEREDDPAALLLGMVPHWQRICNGHVRISVEAEPGLEMSQSSRTVAIMIAQELVLNTMKHAFPGRKSGTIWVRLFATDPNSATLQVEDDGFGNSSPCSDMSDTEASRHGRALVQDLAQALGGTMRRDRVETHAGHCVSVSWPM